MSIKVDAIAYHRNGVAGNGFHVLCFTTTRPRERMIAYVFEERGNVAVMRRSDVGAGIIDSDEAAWRGDHFEPELRHAIEAWENERAPKDCCTCKFDSLGNQSDTELPPICAECKRPEFGATPSNWQPKEVPANAPPAKVCITV
jgi:hypothetical protein